MALPHAPDPRALSGAGPGGDRPPRQPQPWSLRDYAFVGDGERGALIDPHGNVAWLCAPAWDGDPVFDGLLGGPGLYQVGPREPCVWGGHYEAEAFVWHSRWVTHGSITESAEALACPPNPRSAVLLRRIQAERGTTPLEVRVRLHGPERGFAADWRRAEGRVWTGRLGDLEVRLSGDADFSVEADGRTLAALPVAITGRPIDIVLELSADPLTGPPPPADALWRDTQQHWARVLPPLEGYVARVDARRSLAVLAALTTMEGGMAAAATTSLPERAEMGRDYDYRYAWIRDQAYAGLAGAAAGSDALLDSAVAFVRDRLLEDGPHLRPCYHVDGRHLSSETRALDLPGYPGADEARAGNRAAGQFQLDCFGEALLLLSAAAGRDRLDSDGWRAAATAAEAIRIRWTEPDSGIWELDAKLWTGSRLSCAAGLAAAARRAPQPDAGRWRAQAEHLLGEMRRTGRHPSGRWQRAPDDERCDASLLLPQVRGLLDASDAAATATRETVARDLSFDGFVYRYRHSDGTLGEREGAFLLCNFWMSMAELGAGHETAALAWFERSRSACGPAAIFAEEYDVSQRQLRGNIPQAFVHALLLEAAAALTRRG